MNWNCAASFEHTTLSKIACGFMAGAVGGAFGAFLMNRSQPVIKRLVTSGSSSDRESSEQSQESSSGDSEPATVAVANRISRKVARRELMENQKPIAGSAVHYGYGTLMGGVYGAAAEVVPGITRGDGTIYGAVLWLIGDEVAVPALGLAASPFKSPISTHAEALAAHLVYGLATEVGRRCTKSMLR